MKISKMILIFFIFANILFAQDYIKEYTYNASENDSKASARKAALNALKKQLIEEIGIKVVSSRDKVTSINDQEYKKIIKTNLQTFSIALTKTEILDEKWDGEKFWIKVSIQIDKNIIDQELKKQIKIQKQKKINNSYAALRDEITVGLYNLRTPKRIRAVSLKAIKLPMEGKDNIRAHQEILYTFARYGIEDEKYREFLFDILNKIEFSRQDYRAYDIFKYLATTKTYNENESKIVLDFLAKMPRNMQSRYYSKILQNFKFNHEDLYIFLDTYLQMIFDGKVGKPVAIEFDREFKKILKVIPQDIAKRLDEKWARR